MLFPNWRKGRGQSSEASGGEHRETGEAEEGTGRPSPGHREGT